MFRQNPVVKVFPDASGAANNFGLQLAINTNQFGRTFQDRYIQYIVCVLQYPYTQHDIITYVIIVRGYTLESGFMKEGGYSGLI